jgi:endonuclease/exonuclease/phosphatase family metal-dependent hydrolase
MISRAVAAAAVLAVSLVPATVSTADATSQGHHGHRGAAVTVMTRNLYLGADINRPIEAALAAQPEGPEAVLLALGHATHETRDIVDQTDFGTRSRLLAREIARKKPDLVGLQEVAWWRSGPLEVDALGVPNATTTDYDFLQMLLDRLSARGVDYTAIHVQTESDVEAPSFLGNPLDGTATETADIRLTMRDVILMRDSKRHDVVDAGGANYRARLDIPIASATYSFIRGYNWADVRVGSRPVRFINTHLEAFSSDLAFAQAQELLAGPAAHSGTTIIACDCNSDPLNDSVKPRDTLPHKAAYELITGPGDFTDQWLDRRPAWKGWTSGLSELVNDPTPAGFDHRIDMIFARDKWGHGLDTMWAKVTGSKLRDRDRATGLWPSDHAGVVIRLR